MEKQKALIVIDMQKGSFTPETPRYDTEGVVKRINDLASKFRAKSLPVIFIQHDGTGSGEFEENSWEWEILDELIVESSDICINKYANDIFYNSNVNARLKELGVEELYITGCATDFCVESSIQSAYTKNYDIVVVADGHTTGQRPHVSAKNVIDHYNWIWQNMIPTKGTLKVLKYEDIEM